jgi:hypothetical protein
MSAPTLEGVLNLIAEFAAVGDDGRVLVTGGEPMLFANETARISAVAHAHGLRFGIETNAYWAKSFEITQRLLRRYRIDDLIISASRFHQIYVPLERVLIAYCVARSMGVRASVRVAVVADEKVDATLAAVRVAVSPDDLIEEPVTGFGRAATIVAPQMRQTVASDDPLLCPSDGPIVMEDGRVDPCCGPFSAFDDHSFAMGNAVDGGTCARILGDPVFARLRRKGVRALVEELDAMDLPVRHHLAQGNACAVCAAVMRDTVLAPAITRLRASGESASTCVEQT